MQHSQVRSRRWIAMPCLLLLGAAQAPDPAPLPYCGASRIELGDGFHARLYMFAGAPDFFLSYDIPADAIRLHGASLDGTPPQIIFYFVDPAAGTYPSLSISYQIGLRDAAGVSINSYFPHVECGNGITLDTPELVPPPAQHLACFEAMQASGSYRLSFSRRRGEPPFGTIEGRWPLRAMVNAVREVRRRELEREGLGQCRFKPAPPPAD